MSIKRFVILVVAIAVYLTALFYITPNPRNIAVSSYAWKYSTLENMFNDLKRIQISNVCLFENAVLSTASPIKFSHKMDENARKEFKDFFAKYKMNIVAYCHVRASDPAEIKQIFEFLKEFNISSITLEAPRESLKYYNDYALQYGVKVGLYNHSTKSKGIYATPELMLEAIKDYPNIGVFPDNGHWVRSGLDAVEECKKLSGKIKNFSMQDVDSKLSYDCVAYGAGDCDLIPLLRELDRQKFDGYIIVMSTAKEEPRKVISPSVDFLRKN